MFPIPNTCWGAGSLTMLSTVTWLLGFSRNCFQLSFLCLPTAAQPAVQYSFIFVILFISFPFDCLLYLLAQFLGRNYYFHLVWIECSILCGLFAFVLFLLKCGFCATASVFGACTVFKVLFRVGKLLLEAPGSCLVVQQQWFLNCLLSVCMQRHSWQVISGALPFFCLCYTSSVLHSPLIRPFDSYWSGHQLHHQLGAQPFYSLFGVIYCVFFLGGLKLISLKGSLALRY